MTKVQNNMTLDEKLLNLDRKIGKLNYVINMGEDTNLDKLSIYYAKSLVELYTKMLENKQYDMTMDLESGKNYKRCKRVLKVKRFIPNHLLDYHGVDRMVIGGLYIVADVYLLPASSLRKCISASKRKAIINPEAFGLPSPRLVNYGTIQHVNSDVCVAFAKSQLNTAMPELGPTDIDNQLLFLNSWIKVASQYEYVNLNL